MSSSGGEVVVIRRQSIFLDEKQQMAKRRSFQQKCNLTVETCKETKIYAGKMLHVLHETYIRDQTQTFSHAVSILVNA
jgi:hypothetical protein